MRCRHGRRHARQGHQCRSRAPSIPARTPTVEDGPPEEKRSLSNLYLNPPPDEDDDIYNESDSDEEGGEEEGWDEEGRRPRSPLRLSKDYTFGYEEEEGGGDGGGVTRTQQQQQIMLVVTRRLMSVRKRRAAR